MHPIPYSTEASDRHSWAFYTQETPVSEELRHEITTSFCDVREEVVAPHRRMNKGESPFWGFTSWMKYRELATEWLDEVCELGKGAYRINAAPGQLILVNEPYTGSVIVARFVVNPLPLGDRPLPVYRWFQCGLLQRREKFPAIRSFSDFEWWGGITGSHLYPSALGSKGQQDVKGGGYEPYVPEPRKSGICGKLPPAELVGNYKPCDKPAGHIGSHEYEPIREDAGLVNENIADFRVWKRERCTACEEYRLCEPQTGLCIACVSGLAP